MDLHHVTFKNTRDLQVFIDSNQLAWFNFKNIQTILEFDDDYDALSHVFKHNYETWNRLYGCGEPTYFWKSDPIFINEAGLYQLYPHSPAEWKKISLFSQWITEEVIPDRRECRRRNDIEFFCGLSQADLNDASMRRGFIYITTTPYLESINIYRILSSTDVENRLRIISDNTFEDWEVVAKFETTDRFVDEFRMYNILQPHLNKKTFYKFTSRDDAIAICKNAYITVKTRSSSHYYDEFMNLKKYVYLPCAPCGTYHELNEHCEKTGLFPIQL